MMTDSNHFVLTEAYEPWAVERLKSVGRVVTLKNVDEPSVIAAARDANALLVRTYTRVTRAVIEAGRNLRVIGRAGVGVENIDLVAASERGIPVVYTPGAATEAVADLTVGLMIGLVRDFAGTDRMVRSGQFREARDSNLGSEMSELKVGIVGMGRVGKAVARRCALGFNMPVVYNDIVNVAPMEFPVRSVSKEELFRESDLISLHVPLTDSTRNLIDREVLLRMKPTTRIVNTSRGAVVDPLALADALCADRLGGAALDVFHPEPLPRDHPLMNAPRTLFTPHIGARTRLGQKRMNEVVEDVLRVLRGETPCFAAVPNRS